MERRHYPLHCKKDFTNINVANIVEMLMDAGADINIANNRGETPLLCAENRGLDYVVQTLINAGEKDADALLIQAMTIKDTDIVKNIN